MEKVSFLLKLVGVERHLLRVYLKESEVKKLLQGAKEIDSYMAVDASHVTVYSSELLGTFATIQLRGFDMVIIFLGITLSYEG